MMHRASERISAKAENAEECSSHVQTSAGSADESG